jgi:decaprenyl-phosphate phosphoribosyltransferase
VADLDAPTVAAVEPPNGPSGGPTAYLRLLRPRQWVKNLLVLAAPAAAGALDEWEYLSQALLVLISFCLAASGTYCINDAADADADRHHPTKRNRPVATGEVSPGQARRLGVLLLVAGVGLGLVAGAWEVSAVTALYVLLSTLYTVWLKHVAVVDLVLVASFFVLRAVSGVVGTDLPISDWYLIVASFGALFLVAGKRTTELRVPDATRHRPALAAYTPGFLLHVRSVAAGVTLLAYCLWAFEKADVASSSVPWFELSIVPFLVLLLRYALVLETEDRRGPEEILLGDRTLQVIGLCWGLVFAAGVYLGDAPPLTT